MASYTAPKHLKMDCLLYGFSVPVSIVYIFLLQQAEGVSEPFYNRVVQLEYLLHPLHNYFIDKSAPDTIE